MTDVAVHSEAELRAETRGAPPAMGGDRAVTLTSHFVLILWTLMS